MKDDVLFDLDGTLTQSDPGIINSVLYALQAMGAASPPPEILQKFIGPPLAQSFRAFCGFSAEEAEECVRLYRQRYEDKGIYENSLYQGVPQLLSSLVSGGKVLHLATSKPLVYARQILGHFDIAHHFESVYGPAIGETTLPKEAIIARLLSEQEIPAQRAIMVGDRHHDIEGARANRVFSVGVLYGYGSREELVRAGADHIAEDIPSLLSFLIAS